MYNQGSGHLLVWTGQQWMTVQNNPSSPTGVNLNNASIILMEANRISDEQRIKRWWSMATYMVVGLVLGRIFIVILEMVANHYWPS